MPQLNAWYNNYELISVGEAKKKQLTSPWIVGNDFTEEVTFVLGLKGYIRVYQEVRSIPTGKIKKYNEIGGWEVETHRVE